MRRELAGRARATRHTSSMKAILKATLAAMLSGILVGALLKKKVADTRIR